MFIEDKVLLMTTTNFQIFMMIMSEKEARDKKEAVKQVLALLLPEYTVLFTPNSLVFKKDDNTVVIDENNFEIF
jgi:hypothetical protein